MILKTRLSYTKWQTQTLGTYFNLKIMLDAWNNLAQKKNQWRKIVKCNGKKPSNPHSYTPVISRALIINQLISSSTAHCIPLHSLWTWQNAGMIFWIIMDDDKYLKIKNECSFFFMEINLFFSLHLEPSLHNFCSCKINLFISKSLIIHSQSPYKNHKVPKQ